MGYIPWSSSRERIAQSGGTAWSWLPHTTSSPARPWTSLQIIIIKYCYKHFKDMPGLFTIQKDFYIHVYHETSLNFLGSVSGTWRNFGHSCSAHLLAFLYLFPIIYLIIKPSLFILFHLSNYIAFTFQWLRDLVCGFHHTMK